MNFKKISALTPEDRNKVKNYWTDLWGSEFATALTTDFENEGRSKDVKASESNKITKVSKVTL